MSDNTCNCDQHTRRIDGTHKCLTCGGHVPGKEPKSTKPVFVFDERSYGPPITEADKELQALCHALSTPDPSQPDAERWKVECVRDNEVKYLVSKPTQHSAYGHLSKATANSHAAALNEVDDLRRRVVELEADRKLLRSLMIDIKKAHAWHLQLNGEDDADEELVNKAREDLEYAITAMGSFCDESWTESYLHRVRQRNEREAQLDGQLTAKDEQIERLASLVNDYSHMMIEHANTQIKQALKDRNLVFRTVFESHGLEVDQHDCRDVVEIAKVEIGSDAAVETVRNADSHYRKWLDERHRLHKLFNELSKPVQPADIDATGGEG